MIRVGILGDIGSGKSYVANQFGYPVFNADQEVSKLYKKNKKIFFKLKKKLPKYINSVPSIVVGETNQIFVGNQIIGWLKMQPIIKNKEQRNYSPKQAHSQPEAARAGQGQITSHHQKKVVKEDTGPNAWHNNEMNAFSDMYSFIGIDSSAKGDGGMSMIHNFETMGGDTAKVPSGLGRMPGGAPSNPSIPLIATKYFCLYIWRWKRI